MAQEREVERWITVKGARVPIFKGQSVEEADKEHVGKISGKKKAGGEKSGSSFEPGKQKTGMAHAKDQVDMLKQELKKHPDDMHTAEIKQRLAKAQAAYKKFQQGKDGYEDKEHFKTAKEWAGQEKRFTADDMSSKELDNAPVGSKVSFEGETWKKTGKDTWRNSRNGEEWSGRDVYRQRIEGEEDMEVKLSAPSKASEQINSKGTMSPEELSKAENRRDKLWNKQDHGKITDKEKKELKDLEKSISGHYIAKKADGGENKLSGKSTEQLQEIKKNLEAGAKITGTSQGTAKQLAEINKELERRKTDGGENARIGIYKKQLQDVQEDIKQFQDTPPSLRTQYFKRKLAELKKKERDLKGWIDNDINARKNEDIKEKQLAANKQQASEAAGKKVDSVNKRADQIFEEGQKHRILSKPGEAGKRGTTPEFKTYDEAKEYYQKRFSEMSPQNMNRIARNMQIGGRGKEKIAALAEAKAKEWQKGSAVQEERDKQARHVAERVAQEQAYASMNQRRRELKEQRRADAGKDRMQATNNNLERKLATSLKKYNHPNADKEAYNLIEAYKKGQLEPERLTMWGLSKDELKSLSAQGKTEAEHDVASGRTKKKVMGIDGKVHTVDKKTAYEKNYGVDISRSAAKSNISKESAGAMSNVYDGGKSNTAQPAKVYKGKGAINSKNSAEDMLGTGRNGLSLHQTGRSVTDTTYELRDKQGNVVGKVVESNNSKQSKMTLYGNKSTGTSSGSSKPKYSKDETVHVRIPAKVAGVPNGAVVRAKIFSVKEDGSYLVSSAKYGLMRYSADEIYKSRKDAGKK